MGCTSERDLGEDASSFAPWSLCAGTHKLHTFFPDFNNCLITLHVLSVLMSHP